MRRKADRLIIKGLNITVSVMGALMLAQNGLVEGFSKSRTIGSIAIVAIVICRTLEDLQRAIRKSAGGSGDEKTRRKGRRVSSKVPKDHLPGTPWTDVCFYGYREKDGDSSIDAEAL